MLQGNYNLQTDDELVVILKSGDMNAFHMIYNKNWRKIYSESYKRLKNVEQVEEIVQEIFAQLWLKRESITINNLHRYLMKRTCHEVFAMSQREEINPEFEGPLLQKAIDEGFIS